MIPFSAAIFAISVLWWLLLGDGVGLFRSKFTPQALVWVNRVSGLVVVGFGVFAFGKVLLPH
jgi:arginine exporter protein ArgO